MRRYDGRVRQMMAKLLVILAVLLMPLGMQPAAAHDHAMQAGMAMQHCPDQQSSHESNVGFAACTMVCASALPAANLTQIDAVPLREVPLAAAVIERLEGLHPETATPPPKLG